MGMPDHIRPVLERATAAFEREFGARPLWAAAAPGRVNLIGEHTDYNGGLVLPIAIDRVCVVVGGPAPNAAMSRVYSDDLRRSVIGDLRSPLAAGGSGASAVEIGSWASYILGVIAQFQGDASLSNLDIAVASSVPLGSGLSSSASVEVATATLMEHVVGKKLEPLAKARLCQKAEHEFAGVPCGIMDMLASVKGEAGHALLIDCESCEVRPVALPRGIEVIVVNSNVKHALAGGEYAKRRAACEAAARKLGMASLRRARMGMIDGRLTDEEARCARHVITEIERTERAAAALTTGDVETVGRLFAESHESLRDHLVVSCRELDALVDLARAQEGVIGARMTGGGFGGCIVGLVREGWARDAMARVVESYRHGLGAEATAFGVEAAEGAGPISVD